MAVTAGGSEEKEGKGTTVAYDEGNDSDGDGRFEWPLTRRADEEAAEDGGRGALWGRSEAKPKND